MKLRYALVFALLAVLPLVAAEPNVGLPGTWVKMFNGKNLNGWKASERPEAWSVVKEDGKPALKGTGPVSHLFWMTEECENCEFKAEVKIMDGSNSGMYFRTAFGPGFPKGYEAQVNATHRDPVKTGSLYGFARNLESPSKPGEWFTQHIIAQGTKIVILVNNRIITVTNDEKKTHTKGHIALQQHDPKSTVFYRNLMFKKLP